MKFLSKSKQILAKKIKKCLLILSKVKWNRLVELESITQLLAGYDNALFGSFIVSVFIIITGRISLRYSSSEFRSSEVQTSHVGATPRIGEIAIVSECIYCWWVTENFSTNYLGYLVLSGLPVLYWAC